MNACHKYLDIKYLSILKSTRRIIRYSPSNNFQNVYFIRSLLLLKSIKENIEARKTNSIKRPFYCYLLQLIMKISANIFVHQATF